MTYNIIVTPVEAYLFGVVVIISNGDGIVLQGETSVSCEAETEAYEYAETVFLPDLQRNFPREIGEMVIESEVVE